MKKIFYRTLFTVANGITTSYFLAIILSPIIRRLTAKGTLTWEITLIIIIALATTEVVQCNRVFNTIAEEKGQPLSEKQKQFLFIFASIINPILLFLIFYSGIL